MSSSKNKDKKLLELLDEQLQTLPESSQRFGDLHLNMQTAKEIVHAFKEKKQCLSSRQQIGGTHYQDFVIQPFEFFIKNSIPFHKADIIKRILRYDKPTGKGEEDLKKIKHEVNLIIEFQYEQ
jgi:hypothetical protein